MLFSYFKIAWRNLTRSKGFSAINIFGLALGMSCSLLIMLWISDERSKDNFHINGHQLYQVFERQSYDGKVEAGYSTQGLLAEELKKVIPEIQFASSFEYASPPGTNNTFESGDKVYKMKGFFAGADFFNMFSYPLLAGKATPALEAPLSLAISRDMAEKFFGSIQQAMGQTIRYDNKEDLVITAVFENPPANSSQQFDFLRSWVAFVKSNKWVNNWSNTSPSTYVQLRAEADPTKVEAKIKDFIYRYKPREQGSVTELALQPYSDRYLHSSFKNGQIDGGRIEYVNLFTWVAIFILLIACINFMNLATARSVKRAKEVGLRKVIGAVRSSLIAQFIGEALLLTLFSVLLALILVAFILPSFNNFTGKQLSMPVSDPYFWFALLALLMITGLVAGSYPAIFLSSLKPVTILKGDLKFGWGATFFRKGLVVFQFTLSIVLFFAMIVIYEQMQYIQSKNLGYDRENLIYIPIEGDLVKNYQLFKSEAAKLPGILSVSKMRNSPTVIEHHTSSISWPGKNENLTVSFADAVVGYEFVKTMRLNIVEGRDFSKEFGSDTGSFVLNETAVSKMDLKHPLGTNITWGNRPGTVIGVLKDFHFSSMHQPIEPLIIRLDDNWSWGTILVRTKAENIVGSIRNLENICKSLNPKFPFTYQFSDEEFTKLYKSEQIVSKLSNYFAFLAILISCLGLFGLATFTASQRTKEIGVRKVLGASVPNIVSLLSGSFLKLVLIAHLVAFPLAWLLMNQWLDNFAYKIRIEWWFFLIAALSTVSIAWFTISYQSIKSALRNPIKSLRTE